MNDDQATAIVAAILLAASLKSVTHPAELQNYPRETAIQVARALVTEAKQRIG